MPPVGRDRRQRGFVVADDAMSLVYAIMVVGRLLGALLTICVHTAWVVYVGCFNSFVYGSIMREFVTYPWDRHHHYLCPHGA